jgi:hypothetical protein
MRGHFQHPTLVRQRVPDWPFDEIGCNPLHNFHFTSARWKEFFFWSAVKRPWIQNSRQSIRNCRVADYGAGWGRIARYSAKDLPLGLYSFESQIPSFASSTEPVGDELLGCDVTLLTCRSRAAVRKSPIHDSTRPASKIEMIAWKYAKIKRIRRFVAPSLQMFARRAPDASRSIPLWPQVRWIAGSHARERRVTGVAGSHVNTLHRVTHYRGWPSSRRERVQKIEHLG